MLLDSPRSAAIGLLLPLLTLGPHLLPVALAQLSVPEILLQEDAWLLIESKQKTESIPEDLDDWPPTSRHVRQYFSLKNGAKSIVFEESVQADKRLTQLTHEGRYYLVPSEPEEQSDSAGGATTESCHLDHRHDHSALFPWRHGSSRAAQRLVERPTRSSRQAGSEGLRSAQLAGLVGLWLNLQEDRRSKCEFTDEQRETLLCGAESENGSLKYEIAFKLGRKAEEQSRPMRAKVVRANSIHVDQRSALLQVTLEAEISEFKILDEREASRIQKRFDGLVALCRRASKLVFPSLLRQVAESEQRSYHFAYTVNLYEPPARPGDKQVLLARQNVQEWFSYELATQTITRSFLRAPNTNSSASTLRGEKYLRIFNIMPDASVNYKIVFSADAREPFACQFGSLDGDTSLASGSSLLRRPLEFYKHAATKGRHRGELIGLGALLMNIADVHLRRASELQHEARLGARNNYQAQVEWQVDDFAGTGQRWLLYFRKPTLKQLAEHESSVADLTRIELRQRVATKVEESGQRLRGASAALFYGLLMEIEVNDFANSLYQDEMDRAFRVPPICPAAEDVQLDESRVGKRAQIILPTQKQHQAGQDDDEAAFEDSMEFPSFDERLSLDPNYKMSSRWKFVDADLKLNIELRATEYFDMEARSAGQFGKQVERSLFTRLDLALMDPETGGERDRTRYFLYHSINLIVVCRDSEKRCSQTYSLDHWLMVMSSETLYQFDSIQLEPGAERLRHFGVGALWSLASGTDLVERRPSSDDGKLVWRLKGQMGGLFDEAAELLFQFEPKEAMQGASSGGAIDELALSSLAINSTKFSDFTKSQAHLLKVDNIVLEPNGAQADDFNLPDYSGESRNFAALNRHVQALMSSDPDERRANFLTLKRCLGLEDGEQASGSLRKLPFKLSYELIVSAGRPGHEPLAERRFQVTEMNSPRLGRGSIRLDTRASGSQSLRFWSLEGDSKLLELVERSACKQAPHLEGLFQLGEPLDMIEGKKARRKMDFLLAHLWDTFGERAMNLDQANETGTLVMSKQTVVIGGHQRHTIRWSLFDDDSNFVVFEFIEPEEGSGGAQLELNSISLIPNEHDKKGVKLRFMLKAAGKLEQKDEQRMSLVPVCEQASRNGAKFPKFSYQLDTQERLHMRSQLVVLESESAVEGAVGGRAGRSYMLDERLQSGRAYRARLFPMGGSNDSESQSSADYLMDLVTGEYFDLSQAGQCKMSPVDGEQGLDYAQHDTIKSLGLKGNEQMVGHLFHSNTPLFYGPVSVWMLADYLKASPLNDHPLQPLHILQLADQTKVDRWFATDFWMLEHPQRPELKMRVAFRRLADAGLHSLALQSVVSSDWHASDPTSESLLTELVSYSFEAALSSSKLEVDEIFRVPKGFGCRRNEKAKRRFTSKDIVVFNELSPFEFEYEASLRVAPECQNSSVSALEPEPVIQSGWLGRCPGTWDTMLIGALRVNQQQEHFLNGTRRSRLRVAARNMGASQTLVRTLDEASGSCSIGHLPAANLLEQSKNEREILLLEFGPERVHLAAKLFKHSERAAREFERIQHFSQLQPDGRLMSSVVYELRSSQLELNERLKGEGFIVKTFHRSPGASGNSSTNSLGSHNYQSEFELEVIILKRAHLKMRISRLQSGECHEIVRAARAQECFMDEEDSASRTLDQSVSQAHLQHHFETGAKHTQRLRSFRLKFEPQEGTLITAQQFASQKEHLERSFMRLLLSSPALVPAMQLGHFRLLFERRQSAIWAHFNLIEPVSLRHTFHLLEGQSLKRQPREVGPSGAELIGELVRSSTEGKCADLCEQRQRKQPGRRLCVAYAYCRDRSCQTLLGPTKHLSEFYSKWLAPNLQANPDCRVLHGDFLQLATSRRYIDDMVESLHEQEGGAPELNKFVLELKLANNATVKFLASQLDESSVNEKLEALDEGQAEPIGDQFVLVKKNGNFQLANVEKRSKYLVARVSHTSSLQACQSACETRDACALVSYCERTQVCTVMANITGWDQYRDLLNFHIAEKQHSCSIYAPNFLKDFELFEATREPKEYCKKAVNFNLEECATYCQLRQTDLEADCLSFDFCQSAGENPVCYLQTMHHTMDDFDESILEQTDSSVVRAQLDGRWPGLRKATFCSHYSRSLIADFALRERSKFVHHKSIVFQGTQLAHCALICRRDETCLAFEYCHLMEGQVNTCYLERNQLASDGEGPREGGAERIGQLDNSSECNVYELKRCHYQEDKALTWRLALNVANLNESSQDEVPRQSKEKGSHFFEALLIVASSALVSGLLLGLAYARMAPQRAPNATMRTTMRASMRQWAPREMERNLPRISRMFSTQVTA